MNAQSTLNHTPQAQAITPLPHSSQNVSFSCPPPPPACSACTISAFNQQCAVAQLAERGLAIRKSKGRGFNPAGGLGGLPSIAVLSSIEKSPKVFVGTRVGSTVVLRLCGCLDASRLQSMNSYSDNKCIWRLCEPARISQMRSILPL